MQSAAQQPWWPDMSRRRAIAAVAAAFGGWAAASGAVWLLAGLPGVLLCVSAGLAAAVWDLVRDG